MGDCEYLNRVKFPWAQKIWGHTYPRDLQKLDGGSPTSRSKTTAVAALKEPYYSRLVEEPTFDKISNSEPTNIASIQKRLPLDEKTSSPSYLEKT